MLTENQFYSIPSLVQWYGNYENYKKLSLKEV